MIFCVKAYHLFWKGFLWFFVWRHTTFFLKRFFMIFCVKAYHHFFRRFFMIFCVKAYHLFWHFFSICYLLKVMQDQPEASGHFVFQILLYTSLLVNSLWFKVIYSLEILWFLSSWSMENMEKYINFLKERPDQLYLLYYFSL